MLRPGQKMSLSFLVWTRPASLQSSVVDPDPHGSGTFAWIRIRIRNYCLLKNERFYFSFQACEFWTLCTVGLLYEIENGIYVIGRFLFLIELKVFFRISKCTEIILYRLDPDPDSHGSGICAWIRIRGKLRAGSGSGINNSGSSTLKRKFDIFCYH